MEIALFAGQRKLSVAADVYTHVMSDGDELDYSARAAVARILSGRVSQKRLLRDPDEGI